MSAQAPLGNHQRGHLALHAHYGNATQSGGRTLNCQYRYADRLSNNFVNMLLDR